MVYDEGHWAAVTLYSAAPVAAAVAATGVVAVTGLRE